MRIELIDTLDDRATRLRGSGESGKFVEWWCCKVVFMGNGYFLRQSLGYKMKLFLKRKTWGC